MWYLNGNIDNGEHVIADGILSKVVKQKGPIYHVINHGETTLSYLIERDGMFAHGTSMDEAKESIKYKIGERDLSKYDTLTNETELTIDECITMYRVITGACESGVRRFVENSDVKAVYTVSEIIALTKGQYGNNTLVTFMEKKNEI